MISINKSYSTPFEYFDPIFFYEKHIDDSGPEIYYLSERAYYQINKLLINLEDFFKKENIELRTKEVYSFVAGNRYKILQEKVYYNSSLVISLLTDMKNIREDIDSIIESDRETLNDIEELDTLIGKAISDKMRCLINIASRKENVELIDKFFSEVTSKIKKQSKKENELGIIIQDEFGLELEIFNIKPIELDIETHYNDDFQEIHEIISKSLAEDSNGIILLHGVKGSGKTTYIRHLTKAVKGKRIIYVSPDIAENISNPTFVSFFIKYPNSVIIIEDAENILKTRKAGGNQAVSNLLNLSDGLLGDALQVQIICTFNSEIQEIDEAIRRPGRLIAEYKFDKLTKNKAQKLAEKLYPDDVIKIDKDMTLADIYNVKKKKFLNEQGKIGFFQDKN